jgi:hypothetical protein
MAAASTDELSMGSWTATDMATIMNMATGITSSHDEYPLRKRMMTDSAFEWFRSVREFDSDADLLARKDVDVMG